MEFENLKLHDHRKEGEFGIKFIYWRLDEPGAKHHETVGPTRDITGFPEKETAFINAARIGYTEPE